MQYSTVLHMLYYARADVQLDRHRALVDELEPQVSKRLSDLNVHPEFYAFRWLTLLLSQEFQMPGVPLGVGLKSPCSPCQHTVYCCPIGVF